MRWHENRQAQDNIASFKQAEAYAHAMYAIADAGLEWDESSSGKYAKASEAAFAAAKAAEVAGLAHEVERWNKWAMIYRDRVIEIEKWLEENEEETKHFAAIEAKAKGMSSAELLRALMDTQDIIKTLGPGHPPRKGWYEEVAAQRLEESIYRDEIKRRRLQEPGKTPTTAQSRKPGYDSCPGCGQPWDLGMQHEEGCHWEAAFSQALARRMSFEQAGAYADAKCQMLEKARGFMGIQEQDHLPAP